MSRMQETEKTDVGETEAQNDHRAIAEDYQHNGFKMCVLFYKKNGRAAVKHFNQTIKVRYEGGRAVSFETV